MAFIPLVLGCGSEPDPVQDKNLLPTDLVTNPHSSAGLDTATISKLPVMLFADTVHDFGNIAANKKVTYEFSFANAGKTPLIISDAKGSCGCTIASYPKDPIAPGDSGLLKVFFDAADKHGHVEKSVAVTTNTARSVHTLYIKANVE